MNEECRFCKHFTLSTNGLYDDGFCHLGRKKPIKMSNWCHSFEHKAEDIILDIYGTQTHKHFVSSYPVDTSSSVIVSTSAASIAPVMGVTVPESYQEKMLDDVEKVKKGTEVKVKVNFGIILAYIKKSWEY